MKMAKRFLSLLLCLALLLSYLPVWGTAAAEEDTRVADPSTMDGWKQLFLPENPNTENAGGVWMDKSVFADDSAFAGTGITLNDDESFLVALSAIASNMSVTGMSNTPTDTMMILDLSSSMYNGSNRTTTTVQTMLDAVNSSIVKLQSINEHNRVGVVIYYGGQDRIQSDSSNSMVLLPLDRYSGTTKFLKVNVSGGKLQSVQVNSGVKNSAGKTMAQTKRTVTNVAGTYAQLGILDAMNQLLAADTTVPATASYQPNADRLPVMIFMSDGEPTAATHNFTQKVNAGMGNNTVSIRSANETDFVTQLTASYAKEKVDRHYAATTPLFYTLSLGSSVSLAVMDPANNTPAAIDAYWNDLLDDGSAKITVYNSPNAWGAPTVKKTYTVKTTTVDGAAFPDRKSQRNYVDRHFTAANAAGLTDAFQNIVNQISLVSEYTPTLVSGDEDLSGYISFVDKVGKYMSVTDIKGILIRDTLFSGAMLSANFVPGGGNLGTYDAPTSLGDEMVWAVQARLGLETAAEARTIIGLAYEYGQLSYTSDAEFSNYIGWYSNAAGKCLGFWHEGITTLPAPTGDPATDPAFLVKSYGFLGEVDERHGVKETDLMYATVQIRKDIATGEETLAFALPAALIPVITYEVELDKSGQVEDFVVSGADHPIRLVYQVSLDESIDPFTVTDVVDAAYLAANTDENGKVWFYTNQYEADNTTGYGKVNTYSYFNPSRQNDKYYYIEDAPVYTDTNGTLYTGDTQPSGTYYRAYTVYTPSGKETRYRRLSADALSTAKRISDGSWYIGAGNVHVNMDGYTVNKRENPTGTLTYVNQPFVDHHNHTIDDPGYNFIVGATLGNNGKIAIEPATGLMLTKVMAGDAAQPTAPFTFVITNVSDPTDSKTYPARLDGADTTVQFAGGKATVELAPGQKLYIAGMTAGQRFTVEEVPTVDYVPDQDVYTVTTVAGSLIPVTVTNDDRGTGVLTITKEVYHSLGADYQMPEKKFTIHVTLSGVGTAGATFPAKGAVSSVTTDAGGSFTLTLGHDDQVEILELPAGTVATVTEPVPGPGFTAAYWESGSQGDGIVTVQKGQIANVTVLNAYVPTKVDPVSITLTGTKTFVTEGDDWNGKEFTFRLQKWDGTAWQIIATATANEHTPTFDFNAALQAEEFTAPGTYAYQVLETNGGQTIDGVTYDATLHTFSVTVADADMDGALEISAVTSSHTGREFGKDGQGNWQIEIAFENKYQATDATLVLDVFKELRNPTGSPLVDLSGYRFGLYHRDTGALFATSELTDSVGEARFILTYGLEDEGDHDYILREIVPENPIPGMTYDDRHYFVTVNVTDNGDGTMSAIISAIFGGDGSGKPVFVNEYVPTSTELEIDFVSKELTGRDLNEGEFEFALMQDGKTLLTGTNDADGKVTFTDKLYFDTVGLYNYTILETTADGNGITTDKTRYNILVTVTDVGGQLAASYQVMNVSGDQIIFQNTYKPAPITYAIRGNKVLEGRNLLNEEFTFVLAADSGTVLQQVKNFADGTFAFAPMRFTAPGAYRYRVWEQTKENAHGITFDETVIEVTLTVTDDGLGNLSVTDVDYGDQESLTFTNFYNPAPTHTDLGGSKVLEGKVLTDGAFTFELYTSDENWTTGELLQAVANGEDGIFAFETLDYDTAGDRYYLVKERFGGQTIDGVTYDSTVYRVRVSVTDDLLGQLSAFAHTYDAEGNELDAITFRNSYVATGEILVDLEGSKELIGRDLKEGEFSFTLWQDDIALQTVTNDADGLFRFDPRAFHHVGTYTFRIAEVAGDLPGVGYDAAAYDVTILVGHDGFGGLTLESVTYTKDGEAAERIVFINRYTAAPTEVTFQGTKVLEGKDLMAGDFRFRLWKTNYAWFETDLLETVSNDENGVFTFSTITYDTAGTYQYLILEENTGMDGVIYDETIYCILVEVTDNGLGQLEATVEINKSTGDVAEELIFTNTYEEEPPTEPSDPPTEPSEPPTEPSEPPTEPSEPPTEPSEPPTEPTDPPTEPTTQPTEPTTPEEEIPKTGDVWVNGWMAILALSCGGALMLLPRKRKLDV